MQALPFDLPPPPDLPSSIAACTTAINDDLQTFLSDDSETTHLFRTARAIRLLLVDRTHADTLHMKRGQQGYQGKPSTAREGKRKQQEQVELRVFNAHTERAYRDTAACLAVSL